MRRFGAVVLGAAAGVVFSGAAAAQARPIVVIDAGHGGEEVGVAYEGILEKDLVLQMSFVIGAEFVNAGFDVVYTRTRDEAVAWNDRRAAAEEAGAALLLMLHINGDEEDTSRNGAEVYAWLEDEASAALGEAVRAAFEEMGSAAVLEPRDWPFLQSDAVPTAMIEIAFMTNPDDQRFLRTAAFHHGVGRALVSAARSVVPVG